MSYWYQGACGMFSLVRRINLRGSHFFCILLLTGVVSFSLGVVYPGLYDRLGSESCPPPQSTGLEDKGRSVYSQHLVPLADPRPIFSRYPQFVAPLVGASRYKGHPIVQDVNATLKVDAWRYSYNVRGIVETSNYLDGSRTAVIVVHPWGVDDGQGWRTPEPAGVSFFGTPEKNRLYLEHTRVVLSPFIERMRGHVALILYTLPGPRDVIRSRAYSSFTRRVTQREREDGLKILGKVLHGSTYSGGTVPSTLNISPIHPVKSYFDNSPGLDASGHYNGKNYWNLPIPLVDTLRYDPSDIVFFDDEGYPLLRESLEKKGIRHTLLVGYAADMCLKTTAAGYENMRQDFNVFIVGDATLATFPAQERPDTATTAELAGMSMENLITETAWIEPVHH